MRRILTAAALAAALLLPATSAGGQRLLQQEEVAAQVRRFLASRLKLRAGEVELRGVRLPAQKISLPGGRLGFRVEAPANTRFVGRFPLILRVVKNGAEVRRVWVRAEVAVYAQVAVARRPIRARQVLKAGDFEIRRRDLAALPSDTVTRPAELEGARALRSLAPGEPVRRSDLELPFLVGQGHLVRLIARRDNLTIFAVGKSLDRGRKGQIIRVLNIDSNKVVQGRVVDRSSVEVLF